MTKIFGGLLLVREGQVTTAHLQIDKLHQNWIAKACLSFDFIGLLVL